jgi:hypothetical protein
MSDAPRVTVAGGGLAGLTAALRLAQRGYRVKLYEQKAYLGGDIASRPREGGIELDVYPHMYLSWYHNFWRLLDDVSQDDRAERFQAFSSVKQLKPGGYPNFTTFTDPFSPSRLVQNLFSGVGPPADMAVFAYAGIDLLAERLNPTMLLDNVSVTGFLHGRPYMTERAAAAFDNFITMVWAIPSYLASAEDYRTYLSYTFANHDPPFWLARDSAYRQVIEPITSALAANNAEIETSRQLTSVSCTGGRVSEIGLQAVRFDEESYRWVGEGDPWTEDVDELILAVPPDALSRLARTGPPGGRIVEAAPKVAEVSRLRSQPIPIVQLFFSHELRKIPPEPVGLYRSPLALAFTDISQTWEDRIERQTVLSVSASEPHGLPGTGPHEDGFAIIRELSKYLNFDPGTEWGQSSAIDWDQTRYEPNTDAQLFVNETGTDVWRPKAACDGVGNLSFAGDFCANRIGMTTIESAVTTGLEAARVVVERRGLGPPIEITEPEPGPEALFLWLRWAWMPYVAAAKTWSAGSDCAGWLRELLTPTRPPPRQRRES